MLNPDDVVGGFVVERKLGEGGLASVWLVRDPVLETRRALKLLSEEWLGSVRVRERFLAEGRILAQLRHPHLVSVIGVLQETGPNGAPSRIGLVMEYLDGENLADLAARGPLPPAQAVALMRGVLDAVQHAHDHGVIHRDLKPQNVIVQPDGGHGRAVVLDFGIAKVQEATLVAGVSGAHTRAFATIGTPEYMSPEQATNAASVDARTDVWSSGVLLYELLMGRRAFHGDSPQAIIQRILRCEYPAPDALPAPLQLILRRALAPAPDDRFPTARAFREALDALPAEVSKVAALPASVPVAEARWETTIARSQANEAPTRSFGQQAALLIGGIAAIAAAATLSAVFGGWLLYRLAPASPVSAPEAPVEVPAEVTPAPAPPPPADPVPVEAAPTPPLPAPPAPPTTAPVASPPKPPKAPKPEPAEPTEEQRLRDAWKRFTPTLDACWQRHGDGESSVWKIEVSLTADGRVTKASAHAARGFEPKVASCIGESIRKRFQAGPLASVRRQYFDLRLPTSTKSPG